MRVYVCVSICVCMQVCGVFVCRGWPFERSGGEENESVFSILYLRTFEGEIKDSQRESDLMMDGWSVGVGMKAVDRGRLALKVG